MSQPYHWYDDPTVQLATSPPTAGGPGHRLQLSTANASWTIRGDEAGDGPTFVDVRVCTAANALAGGQYVTPAGRFHSTAWPSQIDYLQISAVQLVGADGAVGDGSTVFNLLLNDVLVDPDGYLLLDDAFTAAGSYPLLTTAGVYSVYYGVGWIDS